MMNLKDRRLLAMSSCAVHPGTNAARPARAGKRSQVRTQTVWENARSRVGRTQRLCTRTRMLCVTCGRGRQGCSRQRPADLICGVFVCRTDTGAGIIRGGDHHKLAAFLGRQRGWERMNVALSQQMHPVRQITDTITHLPDYRVALVCGILRYLPNVRTLFLSLIPTEYAIKASLTRCVRESF